MATSEKEVRVFERNLRKLQNKLNAYYSRIQTIYDSMTKLETSVQIDTFMSNASTVDIIRSDFVRILDERNDLIILNSDTMEPGYESLSAFEELYACIKFKVSKMSEPLHSSSSDVLTKATKT
ncbi:hypothetical protein ACJJTC_001377 [Scirpophaga incertulas]